MTGHHTGHNKLHRCRCNLFARAVNRLVAIVTADKEAAACNEASMQSKHAASSSTAHANLLPSSSVQCTGCKLVQIRAHSPQQVCSTALHVSMLCKEPDHDRRSDQPMTHHTSQTAL